MTASSAGTTRAWGSNPWLVAVILSLALAFLTVVEAGRVSIPQSELPLQRADGLEYLMMAQGRGAEVISPFSRRVLYPFLGRCLSLSTGVPLRTAFLVLDAVSVLLLVHLLARIFLHFGLSPWRVAALVLTPFVIDRIEDGYMPDLFHAMLVTLFFWLLLRERMAAAFLVLAVSYPARENTLILCLVFGALAIARKLYRVALGCAAVIAAGTAFGSWCVRVGQPNIHHLPDFLYLALKMPHQFLKNVLGFRIWTNTLPVGDPFAKWTLPGYLRAGDVRVIGFCYPEWELPLFTLISLLTLFGIGPLIVWLTRRLKIWSAPHPLAVQLAFIYGLVAFLLGTSIGDWVDRLVGYGFPLFWIAVPYVLGRIQGEDRAALLRWCLGGWLIVAWIPEIVLFHRGSSLTLSLLVLAATALAYFVCRRKLRRFEIGEDL